MNFDKAFKEFSVFVYGNLVPYNEVLSKARCRIFYRYFNRNGTYITDEFAEKLLSTITYAPIKGIYEEQDYSDHGKYRDQGKIYGLVPENHNFAWEEHLDDDGVMRTYACVDVLLYTGIYKEASEIINKPQSMELYAPSIKGSFQIIEGKKVCVFNLEEEIKNYNKDYKLAPWLGNADRDIKLRVDLELNGETGEINGVKYTRCRFTKIF